MKRSAFWAPLLALSLSGCGAASAPQPTPASPPTIVGTSAVGSLLLGTSDIDALMGADMTPLEPVDAMSDNRNLLPNLNCLGVWQVAEAAVYAERGPDNWQAMRQQMLRQPDIDDWDAIAVQSVVLYESPAAAKEFLSASATRWSECTNHTVNITLNDRSLPSWRSGDLEQTDTRLSIPSTRASGDSSHACQHVLAARSNVIVDVQACKRQDGPATQADDIATAIETRIDDAVSAAGG